MDFLRTQPLPVFPPRNTAKTEYGWLGNAWVAKSRAVSGCQPKCCRNWVHNSNPYSFRFTAGSMERYALRALLCHLERETSSTEDWCLSHIRNVWDILALAVLHDEPGVFRYCIRATSPLEGWEPFTPWLFYFLECASGKIMVKFLTILCEEGVFSVDMMEFAFKHNITGIPDLISQQRPDITSQHCLLRAIALEKNGTVCNLLSQGIWHDRAFATAVGTRNVSVCSLLVGFLCQLGFGDLWHYFRMRPESMRAIPPDGLRFLHGTWTYCCEPNMDRTPNGSSSLTFEDFLDNHSSENCHDFPWDVFGRHLLNFSDIIPSAQTFTVRRRFDAAHGSSSRRMMGLGIAFTLKTFCSELVGFGDQKSGDHRPPALQNLCHYRLVWRHGIRAIRRLMTGTPPRTGYEMLTLLMSTYAMAVAGCSPLQSAFDRVQFVQDLARWRHVLCVDQQQIFDVVTAVLWDFDPSQWNMSFPLVQPDELLLSFQDFVRQFIPTIPKQGSRPHDQEMPYQEDELHAVFGEPDYRRGIALVRGRGNALGGSGSGELLPSEFMDPPCSDGSFTTLEQGLDVLTSLAILYDPFWESGPDDSPTPAMLGAFVPVDDENDDGEHHHASTHPEELSSELVVLLLASVAIGLVILALLACRHGVDSHIFGTILSTYLTLARPLEKSYSLLKAFFLSAFPGTTNFAEPHPNAPSFQRRPSFATSSGESHNVVVTSLHPDLGTVEGHHTTLHSIPSSSTPFMENRCVAPSLNRLNSPITLTPERRKIVRIHPQHFSQRRQQIPAFLAPTVPRRSVHWPLETSTAGQLARNLSANGSRAALWAVTSHLAPFSTGKCTSRRAVLGETLCSLGLVAFFSCVWRF
ncbi:uncharacterized protein B0H64DRAFT_411079 [Chaetomium fimeti]|uniref:Uncharacterized protein n=1 Tax=Chaetomium fimeti TaxID=1854472 RepID=A0AAE0H6X9_9PEZI|nr:hypothetical protein B0H64DRAFT_411079 [Chaetomium fimeti]